MVILPLPTISKGDVFGVVSTSYPAYTQLRDKYQLGLEQFRKLGFKYKEGFITASNSCEIYRSANSKQRALEFMELVEDSSIKGIISSIGGMNTSSLLPYLDYKVISENPKVICGFSDFTAMQMALLTQSGLRTFYGPAITPSFGEPSGFQFTNNFFMRAILGNIKQNTQLDMPIFWSNEFIDAKKCGWRQCKRKYRKNNGWNIIKEGVGEGYSLVANMDTLLSLSGTKFFPSIDGCVLFLEETTASFGQLERNFNFLKLLDVERSIHGMIFSKVDQLSGEKNSDKVRLLIKEIFGEARFPIVSDFDCGHTYPMLTIPQMSWVKISAKRRERVKVEIKYR